MMSKDDIRRAALHAHQAEKSLEAVFEMLRPFDENWCTNKSWGQPTSSG